MENVNYSDKYAIMQAVQDIAYNSEGQSDLSAKLSELRQAAYAAGEFDNFNEGFVIARNTLDCDRDFQRTGLALMYDYSLEDFQNSEDPYRDVFEQENTFLQQRALERMAAMAAKVGFKSFKKTYSAFVKSLRQVNQSTSYALNPTCFPNQPLELEAGEWLCDERGVRKSGAYGDEVVCLHPILPIERLVNIDTNEEKLKVAYCTGDRWRTLIAGKNELFDRSKVIKLSSQGVSVTSDTSSNLSKYLCEIEAMNYDRIPEVKSVSRLGYIKNGQFSPYVDDLTFDGESNYAAIYDAISKHKGTFEAWKETALRCRSDSLTAQIMLAASFASVLINKIGGLCFFVHLWGGSSGTGKSVALMLAASVWGYPEIGGEYVETFNATQVGHERTAAFLNNIPMCIDELQLSKDSHGRSRFDVYQLAQGVGRTRGTKSGGLDKTPKWSLSILTTGEGPIVRESAGAGAINRVIDIECRPDDKVIKDGTEAARALKANYGQAGEMFIEALTDDVIEEIKREYDATFAELCKGETTEKQAMAAAMIITADKYADKFILKTGKSLTIREMAEFLKTKASVSVGQRGYEYMCDWVSSHYNSFLVRDEHGTYNMVNGEVFGEISGDTVFINSSVFRKAVSDAGYEDRALLSWLNSNGLLEKGKRGLTKRVRLGKGAPAQCVVMKLNDDTEEEYEGFEDLI